MIVVDYNMPNDNTNPPAFWALNGQVVRAAQYGCNCRGMGGDGGCGELDIVEVLQAGSNQAFSEIYSFKGATGSGNNYFPRPTSGRATVAAIFDIQTDSIEIIRLTSWDYSQTSLPRSTIDNYLKAPAMIAAFGTDPSAPSQPSQPSHQGVRLAADPAIHAQPLPCTQQLGSIARQHLLAPQRSVARLSSQWQWHNCPH